MTFVVVISIPLGTQNSINIFIQATEFLKVIDLKNIKPIFVRKTINKDSYDV